MTKSFRQCGRDLLFAVDTLASVIRLFSDFSKPAPQYSQQAPTTPHYEPATNQTMRKWIRRSNTFDCTLPERSLLSGMGKTSNPILRLSERRLVRKISSSLHSDNEDVVEDTATVMSESGGSDNFRSCFEDHSHNSECCFNIATDFVNALSTAPLNRKELEMT